MGIRFEDRDGAAILELPCVCGHAIVRLDIFDDNEVYFSIYADPRSWKARIKGIYSLLRGRDFFVEELVWDKDLLKQIMDVVGKLV